MFDKTCIGSTISTIFIGKTGNLLVVREFSEWENITYVTYLIFICMLLVVGGTHSFFMKT